MTTPPSIRRAYERGRLRNAAVQTVPVLLLPLFVSAAAGYARPQGILVGVLLLAFLMFRWRGLGWGRGAVLGVLAGAIPALAAAGLMSVGLGCVGGACATWCAWFCAGAGVVGGAFLGFRAAEPTVLGAGVVVAAAAGSLGCWPMGLGVMAGMAAMLALTAASVVGARALLR